VLVGTFTGVKYIVNSNRHNQRQTRAEIEKIKTVELVNIQRDMAVLTEKTNTILQKLERAEGTWEMAENLYELLANRVNDLEWDIKDLNREINY
jgi:archaellum component FlaC